MVVKGSLVQYKTNPVYMGVVVCVNMVEVRIRYVHTRTTLTHGNMSYSHSEFMELWEIIN